MNTEEVVSSVCERLVEQTITDSGGVRQAGAALTVRGAHPGADQHRRAQVITRELMPLSTDAEIDAVVAAAIAHTSGLGPLERFLADPAVNEIMVNNGGDVWLERNGSIVRAGRLADDVTPRLIERIISPLGRRLDRLSPIVDARLADGSRVCAVIPPIAVDGPCLTLRRFGVARRTIAEFGDGSVCQLLVDIVESRCNVVVSGATSSGKTSLLNALGSLVGATERIVTLEDTAELRLDASHILRLETRPATVDGTTAVTMTDLVRTALRLRPDRIVVGEVRGAEVVDMLAAMNTGHAGSLTTCHANGPEDALRRLEALVAQHSPSWPLDAVREAIHSSIDVVVHVDRLPDGQRRIGSVLELARPGTGAPHRPLVQDGASVGRLQRGHR